MMRHRIAPVIGLALLFAVGCVDSAQDDSAQAADALRDATEELRQDVRSSLDDFGTQMERLDQQYMSAADDVADGWSDTRTEMREYREGIEANLAQLETATADDAQRLKRDIAEDLERLTERVERAELESVEDGEEFLSASRDRMDRLEEDFEALGDEAASLSEAAREEASGPLEALRDRANELETHLNGLADATAEEIASERDDIAQAIGVLAASVRRELFEMRQAVTE
ncbi:MAG: hypothetical protein WEB90_05095 [Gemmatimonadota bacterium]